MSCHGKKLIIVESPSKCKTFNKILGKGYFCTASKGHLREIDTKSFDIHSWNKGEGECEGIKFKIINRQYKTVKQLKQYIASCSEVILATDCDREGEAIAWHVCQLFDLPLQNTKRILFKEITPTAILQAVRNPSIINMNIVDAQLSRQISDLVIGYTISPLLWKYIGVYSKQSLSAGRCQTPTLKLIYDHYIGEYNYYNHPDNLKVQHHIKTDFLIDNIVIHAKLNTYFESDKDTHSFLQKSFTFQHECTSIKECEKELTPPVPLITTSLQQLSAQYLHFSPKQTMMYAQTLYEKGFITYMRTDSPIYSDTFMDIVLSYIEETYGSEYKRDSYYSGKISTHSSNKIKSQDAHEAIRPTKIHIVSALDGKENRLYQFIRNHTLQSCMTNAVYKTMDIIISAPINYTYHTVLKKLMFDGFKCVTKSLEIKTNTDTDTDTDTSVQYDNMSHYINTVSLPFLCTRQKSISVPCIKEYKPRFSESSIIKTLEKEGIGRPSTYTNLVETIQTRNYVNKENITGKTIVVSSFSLFDSISEVGKQEKNLEVGSQKNKLSISNLGIVVCRFLYESKFSPLFDYTYTRKMETSLDCIASGGLTKNQYLDYLHKDITEYIQYIDPKKVSKFQIVLNDKNIYMFSRYGESIKNTETKKTFGLKSDTKIDLLPWIGIVKRPDGYPDMNIYTSCLDTNKSSEDDKSTITIPEVEQLTDSTKHKDGKFIGYQPGTNYSIYLKCGPYGYYLEIGETITVTKQLKTKTKTKQILRKVETISLKSYNLTNQEIEKGNLHFFLHLLDSEKEKREKNQQNHVQLTQYASLRESKYGKYIFYQNSTMKKPKFLSLKGCPFDINELKNKSSTWTSILIEWVHEKHNLSIG
jgi:DNA topoisomerase I